MGKSVLRRLCFCFTVVFFNVCFLCAQSVEIDYKSRIRSTYAASIYFSDGTADQAPDPEEVHANEHVFFTIAVNQRSQRDHFRVSDLDDDLSQIELIQEGRKIPRAGRLQPVDDKEGRFTRVLMSYPKNEVKMYKPFVFVNQMDTTPIIMLDEVFYNNYFHYLNLYEEAIKLKLAGENKAAFIKLISIVNAAVNEPEITHYSFFKDASETMMEALINACIDQNLFVYDSISQAYREQIDNKMLSRIDSVYHSLVEDKHVFNSYFDMDFPGSKSLEIKFIEMIKAIEASHTENHRTFRNHHLVFFESGVYSDFQFTFYIDVIARLLTHIDAYRQLEHLDTLNLNLLNNMQGIKRTMNLTGWLEDFSTKVALINQDIVSHQFVFSQKIVDRLGMMTAYQPQPYYEIIQAFNEKSTNAFEFNRLMKGALTYCSDEELMQNIEMWIISYDFTLKDIDETTINSINKGLKLIQQKNWTAARDAFDIVTRQANNLATPWYYAGIVDMKLNNEFAAQAKFKHALTRYPLYLSVRMYLFSWMYGLEMFDDLLEETIKATELADIFIFRFWKAKTLLALGRFEDAIEQIQQHCHQKNPHDIYSWFLLGDAFLAGNQIVQAKGAYEQTQKLNPFDYTDLYDQKMRILFEVSPEQ
jgi:tetratricopeptide (TPR) repeat protein